MRPDPYNPSAFLGIEVLEFRWGAAGYWVVGRSWVVGCSYR